MLTSAHCVSPSLAGRQLLSEQPQLSLTCAQLLAKLRKGLKVHKAWLRAGGSCASGGGSNRCGAGKEA